MYKVISPRSCRESAQSLMETLNSVYPNDRDVVINWGNSSVSTHNPMNVFGNKLESVGRSANKKLMFDLCKDLGTVPLFAEEASNGWYIHRNSGGQNGSGVYYTEEKHDARTHFSLDYLVTNRILGEEYRVYFCYDMKPMIFKKIKMDDDAPDHAVQCSTNGYGYIENPRELRDVDNLRDILVQYTHKTANRLELSYGAIDFIVEKNTYMVYILESNSAPTLITADLVLGFAEQISNRFGKDVR